jgi:hypothetical protein
LQRLGESGSRTDPIPSSVAFRYFVSPGHFALAFRIMPIQFHRRAVAPMTSHVTCGLRCWPSAMPSGGVAAPAGSRPSPSACRRARPRHPCTVAPPPNVPRPCGPSAAARVGSIFRLRDGSHEARDGAGGGARRIGKGRDCTVCWVGDAAQPASITRRLEIEPAALLGLDAKQVLQIECRQSAWRHAWTFRQLERLFRAESLPVSIDRRTVSPTTRPAPASRMHGWPAVADLTSDRPIRAMATIPEIKVHFSTQHTDIPS